MALLKRFLFSSLSDHRPNKTYWPLFLILALPLSGCAKLQYLDQLLTLKGYSDEQAALDRLVVETDRHFDSILAAARDGSLRDVRNETSVLKTYGQPILKETGTKDSQECVVWLYRHATEYFGSPKLYVRFDAKGDLLDYEIIE